MAASFDRLGGGEEPAAHEDRPDASVPDGGLEDWADRFASPDLEPPLPPPMDPADYRRRVTERSRHSEHSTPDASAMAIAAPRRPWRRGGRTGEVRVGRRASYREGAAFSVLTFGSVAFLAFLSSVLNSRLYGVRVIGEYALVMSTLALVRLLSTTKERPALVRELTLLDPRHPRVTGLFVATLTFSAILTLLVSALALLVTALLLAGPIAQPSVFLPVAVTVAGYVVLGNTGENMDVVFNGFRAGRQTFWVRAGMAVVFLAISAPLGVVMGTVWGLVIATVASMATSLVHRVFLIHRFMRFSASRATLRDGFRTLPGLIRFGLQITPGALADGASNASGTWIVASFSTIGAVGAYGRAYSLVSQLSLLNTRTNEMLFPTLLERRAKQDGAGYARALVDSLRYATIALVIPAAAAAGVADSIMRVFGPGFGQGAPALAILLFSPPLLSLTQMQRQALYSLDRPILGSVSGLLRFAATILAGLFLTWKIGATGAAIAFVLGLLVDFAFATRLVVRNLATPFLKLWPPRQFVALLAACAGSYGCSRIIEAVLPFPLNIFVGVGAGMLAFGLILIGGGGVDKRDRERLQDVRRLVAQRRARSTATADGARGQELGTPGPAR